MLNANRTTGITPDFEAMAAALDATDAYKVLRRLPVRDVVAPDDGAPHRLAVMVDVETTGLDAATDEIIELAMVKFTYGLDGTIRRIGPTFEGFRQAAAPIPTAITRLTGITDEMVAGHVIDPAAVAAFVRESDLVLAHNAAFDRRFLERFCPIFIEKPWACSMSEVDWSSEGFEGTKLGYLAASAGFFYDRHRAVADCLAAIELLSLPLPASGAVAMSRLLESARRPIWRILATGAPFETREKLKARRFRWDGTKRVWYLDVPQDAKEKEIEYLRREIYGGRDGLDVIELTAYERFSSRC